MYFPLLIIILIITKSNSDNAEDINSDMQKCISSDSNSCSSVSLKTKNLECCKSLIHISSAYSIDQNICVALYPDFFLEEIKEYVEALLKEEFGILEYWEEFAYVPMNKFTITYQCKDKSTTFNFGGYDYTNSEIEILKSDNTCFKLFYYSMGDYFGVNQKSVAKNDCINAKILDSTKKAKISCGYSEITILWLDNTSTEFNSCFYLPKSAIKAKQIDSQTQSNFNEMQKYLSSREGKTPKSYKVKITDGDGNVLIYDSATGTVSNSNFIKVKSLVLLFLLAFIF